MPNAQSPIPNPQSLFLLPWRADAVLPHLDEAWVGFNGVVLRFGEEFVMRHFHHQVGDHAGANRYQLHMKPDAGGHKNLHRVAWPEFADG